MLTEFNFDIKFKAGREHVVPDALSRSGNQINNTRELDPSIDLSAENVRKEKLKDVEWRKIINYFEKNNIEGISRDIDLNRFTMENNCLYLINENKHQREFSEVLVIPRSLKSVALFIAHNSNLNFHASFIKTT